MFYQRADFSIEHPDAKLHALTGATGNLTEPQAFWDWVHEADAARVQRHCQQAARTPEGLTAHFRIRHPRTGKLACIQERREAVLDQAGQVVGYHVLWLDVTRQTLAEKRLMAAARKAAFSGATAGFAHDFNNQMAGVLSLSDLLLAQLPPEDTKRPSLELIKRSGTQAAALLKRLVNLLRGKTGTRQYLDLNQVVSENAELVRKILTKRIQVQTELCPEQVPVYLDTVEFGQVVLNLALNAAEAMPTGGSLTLRVTAHAQAPALKTFRGNVSRLPCAAFSMQDTGSGLAARHLPNVFEPFFTTKPPAKGAGLGVYQARLFTEQHDGAISVESTEGAGTTFTLWLPQADFTEAEKLQAEAAQRAPRLLLVGRVGAATDKLAQLLRMHHFELVITHTPERALELLVDGDNQLQGACIATDPADAPLLALPPAIQAEKLGVRLALHLLSGDPERVESALLAHANLVLGPVEHPDALAQKLRHLLLATPPL